MPRHSRLLLSTASVYALVLVLIGFWPTHVDNNLGIANSAPVHFMVDHLGMTQTQGYDLVEFSANVALFVPLGAIALFALPRIRWIGAVAIGIAVSGAVELVQDIALPDRTASLTDVLANTLGSAIGAALVTGRRGTRSRSIWGSRPYARKTEVVIVSTFAMPTNDAAPFSVGASLVSFSDRASLEWFDNPDGRTYLVITHEQQDTKRIEHLALRADADVELVSSTGVEDES